ncbi:uncharacterized protein A1O9_05587 [Exophiala aquamarina CBS 119918]|uniref:Alpha/beta hydrolase fold-3 domain-containing protein n=1 Tax=Exophiala aquamarina CBS 119918 TaxID=1182545 RepID=A0A072PC36_9EURO|nr:uncharacterized protein A1O9_05587 [Exophiala aquamarina CBS 119918]KEF57669.1 hypothetical protein A1O9_05587 [Exophiala aquamarina CBS 119918]
MSSLFHHPFGISWRKALVSLPRLVPDAVLHFTSPEGPQPIVFDVPSREAHLIPVYVFIPPRNNQHHHLVSPGAHLKQALSDSQKDPHEKLPVLIDFHGGSFILGSCQEQSPFCAQMCRELNCVVISVDYRLGPYATYPAANLDAEDVVLAVIDREKQSYRTLRESINRHLDKEARRRIELDEDRIAFSGFSSGGNLALNLALSVKNDPTIHRDWLSPVPWSHKSEIPVLLFYPSLDCRLLPHERPRPEGLDPPSGFVERWRLEAELMPTYLPVANRPHPRASPGLADIKAPSSADGKQTEQYGLHPQAKLFLVLPQFDSLNGQSLDWIEKVRAEGRGSDLIVEDVKGVTHGWTQFPDGFISDEHRKLKVEVFRKARVFLGVWWDVTGMKSGHADLKEVKVEVLGDDKPGSGDKAPGKGVDVMIERERYPKAE